VLTLESTIKKTRATAAGRITGLQYKGVGTILRWAETASIVVD
jgi:hypothetical protein